ARCESLSTRPRSSPDPIARTLPGAGRLASCGTPLDQHEVVPVHGLLGGVRDQLADLVGAQALDPAELAGGVVDDPLADGLAVGSDLDGIARLELAIDVGDPDRQQAAAALPQHPGRAAGDTRRAVARPRRAAPP